MQKKSFVKGTIILTFAGFIVKILGFSYRLYLSNSIGAEGMGVFQLISPIYSLIVLTLTSGVSISVSKMVAEQYAKDDNISPRRITKYALIMVVAVAVFVSCAMLLFAGKVSAHILKDDRTYYSLALLSPCIPIVVAASAFKGYFYAVNDVMPTAFSQVTEQLVKIGFILFMSNRIMSLGLSYACALATVSMAVGEMANLVVLLLMYRRNRGVMRQKRCSMEEKFSKYTNRNNEQQQVKRHLHTLSRRAIVTKLIRIIVPVSFNRFVTSAMSAIELILIPRMLVIGGMNYQSSMVEYGKLIGMALPLILFPCLATSSIATTLVPAISEALSVKRFRTVNHRISRSIQITFVLGFISTAIFFVFPEQIGNILYKKEYIGGMLKLLSFTCVFTYLQQTLLGILNGLDKQGVSLRNSMLGYAIRVAFVCFAIPIYGIKGYVIGICVSMGLVCCMNIYTITKLTGMSLDIRNWVIKPAFISLVVIFCNKYIYSLFLILNFGSTWTTLMTVLCDLVISASLMIFAGIFNRKEILNMIMPN